MPAKSAKQYRLMAAAAHSKKGIGGIDKDVAKEFVRKTPKKKRSMFSKGKGD